MTNLDTIDVMIEEILEPLERLTKDAKKAAANINIKEVESLVSLYYTVQEDRIRAENKLRKLKEVNEPYSYIEWVYDNFWRHERSIHSILDVYSKSTDICIWARSIRGIGPVISSGLHSQIDINKAPTVGHIWRSAGLDPTVKWERKEKRPWNADLKTLCFKLGESFIKVQNHPDDIYGKVYASRKVLEIERN